MPRKVRDLINALEKSGLDELKGGAKGSYRKYVHASYPGAVTLSGKPGDDAKPYQEKQIKRAIEIVNE